MRVLNQIKQALATVPGLLWLKRRLFGIAVSKFRISVIRASQRGDAVTCSRERLIGQYCDAGLDREPDTFVLYRILGNDLFPRHRRGQSRDNLRFILEHEPQLPGCEKRFVVNRIVDPEEEQAIIGLLEDAGVPWLHIPFELSEHAVAEWDVAGVPVEFAPYCSEFTVLSEAQQSRILMRLFRHKNNYVMNNNGARNAALAEGREVAKWVLPWDGNCFVTAAAWERVREGVKAAPEYPYHIVPMARVADNRALLDPGFLPETNEEPQVMFRRDARERFDTDYFYGRRPKVELLWRLGVPGIWDEWPIEPWDLPCPNYSEDAGAFVFTGWVARLASGRNHLDVGGSKTALVDRGLARVESIRNLLDDLDERVWSSRTRSERTVFISYSRDGGLFFAPDSALEAALQAAAEGALERGPFSVLDKTTVAPSGDPHDYFHPAPYYWPHPLRLPFLPYVRRDGQRVPGTQLYEPQSGRYDRTRLQRVFDDTFVLTLAWRQFEEEKYAAHAGALVRRWFLDPETRMNPHLRYAQVRWGHNRNRGNSSGIIEMKDLYYFLDAIRLLEAGGVLDDSEYREFVDWLSAYLEWLRQSEQGQKERASINNHGTYYDLQVGSIAAFLGDWLLLRDTLRDSQMRILQQFECDGQQPGELTRTTTAHYCCFNIQGWIHLAMLAESVGTDFWNFEGPDGRGLRRGMEWLLGYLGRKWPFEQIDEFDQDRFYPIFHTWAARYDNEELGTQAVPALEDIKPIFYPHDGIPPFWQLCIMKLREYPAGRATARRGVA